ncbi:hypothetical protein [Flavilitoribacter nigricans]|uniref:Uncharacterized protein n=1 Tax=Flavilitoribacter nigricans (strain ATCC 23147 / DSM 23189 / NBRC 102662 / NCIMB 1420 / SS-2) TaxID=1122177 RepID=A0A2D0NH96_FLAN2|nr:hypothetical protein [Flavilitoribacter nigricans]PHN07798.1 hypothetical protein CRP01_04565 [Flavilitoribacter nigricans DSM 23189 = NBRC 102662]
MKAVCIFSLVLCALFPSCNTLDDPAEIGTTPDNWGPIHYQIDGILNEDGVQYFARRDSFGQLHYHPESIAETDLPFRFYANQFQYFPEIIIRSPYPIRTNWFQLAAASCLDPGNTATGIEFTVTTAREKDYLLIARLDSTYWECLKSTDEPIRFAFQLLDTYPVLPTPFYLHGFYDLEQEIVHLRAQRDPAGIWHSTVGYLAFQEPGPKDFSMTIVQHPQLGSGQSLLRISSSMQLVPYSLWIGLADECLEQADWEVHRNRLNDRFLLDVVVPDCYLDCLSNVADGFEFEVKFFQ